MNFSAHKKIQFLEDKKNGNSIFLFLVFPYNRFILDEELLLRFSFQKLLYHLGSLKAATILLLFLAAAMSFGTIVEAKYSPMIAKRWVYGAFWFQGLLLFLMLNLIFSAALRWPWKKKHLPFLAAHLGIVLLLFGSWLTQQFGRDGQIALEEEEEGSILQEPIPTLYVRWGDGPQESIRADFPLFPPTPRHPQRIVVNPGLVLEIEKFFLHAVEKEEAKPLETAQKGSPAVLVSVRNVFAEEKRWLFLDIPGHQDVFLGAASFHFVRKGKLPKETAPKAVVLEWEDREKKIFWRLLDGGRWGTAREISPGGETVLPWMGRMEFSVERFFENAAVEVAYEKAPLPRGKDPSPALFFRVRHPVESRGWIGYQRQRFLEIAGKPLVLVYAPRQIRLPFVLRLEDFHMTFNPGTQNPASFESMGSLHDVQKGANLPFRIRMNEPLEYGGWKFFQASYVDLGGGRFLSVLSANRDPGLVFKYTGSMVLILGIIALFQRRWVSHKG